MRLLLWTVALLGVCTCLSARAETIGLKNGDEIIGEIITRDQSTVIIKEYDSGRTRRVMRTAIDYISLNGAPDPDSLKKRGDIKGPATKEVAKGEPEKKEAAPKEGEKKEVEKKEGEKKEAAPPKEGEKKEAAPKEGEKKEAPKAKEGETAKDGEKKDAPKDTEKKDAPKDTEKKEGDAPQTATGDKPADPTAPITPVAPAEKAKRKKLLQGQVAPKEEDQ